MTIVDMKIEVAQVPVSDVDRAKGSYSTQLGFGVDVDTVVPGTGCTCSMPNLEVLRGAVTRMADDRSAPLAAEPDVSRAGDASPPPVAYRPRS
jgi:hypothetical protein